MSDSEAIARAEVWFDMRAAATDRYDEAMAVAQHEYDKAIRAARAEYEAALAVGYGSVDSGGGEMSLRDEALAQTIAELGRMYPSGDPTEHEFLAHFCLVRFLDWVEASVPSVTEVVELIDLLREEER